MNPDAPLTPHHPVIQKLIAARTYFVFHEEEVGAVLITLELVIDNTVEFVVRDGRQILYNVAAVAKAPPPKLEEAMRQLVISSPTDPQME